MPKPCYWEKKRKLAVYMIKQQTLWENINVFWLS